MKTKTYKYLVYFIALVWFINGLYCKVLNLVPRHQQIVEQISPFNNTNKFTIIIGCLEVVLAIWIISDYKPKLQAIIQIITVFTMNAIEFFVVPDILLWGKFNFIIALGFISLIHFTYFIYNTNYVSTT